VFQKSTNTSILQKNITKSEAARWQEQKCEPAQRREFFVKILESGKSEVGRPKLYRMFQKSNSTSNLQKNITRSEAARWETLSGEPAQWLK
jgi:hypothetical protein